MGGSDDGSWVEVMKVRVTLEFPDRYRRAINHALGKPGMATREDCIAHLHMVINGDAQDICSEMDVEELRHK
jgi:hypothetical protein